MRAQALYEKWALKLRERIENGEPVPPKPKPEPEQSITFRKLAERYI
jgi:hypothetical protein